MIFQDPYSSLSPRMKVSTLLLEPFRIHGITVGDEQKVAELLETVGLPEEQADKYPAPALGRPGAPRRHRPGPGAEPGPAGRRRADRRAGRVGGRRHPEPAEGPARAPQPDLPDHHAQPECRRASSPTVRSCTWARSWRWAPPKTLRPPAPIHRGPDVGHRGARPSLRDDRRIILPGEIPSPRNPPPGCPFHPRCRHVEGRCSAELPVLSPLEGAGHYAACHFPVETSKIRECFR